MSVKAITENASSDPPKRRKVSDLTFVSRQSLMQKWNRHVVVRIMSGRVVFHDNLNASMYIADLQRTLMRHYPGKA
eukprot:6291903-Karenia_brevis.AAC.1